MAPQQIDHLIRMANQIALNTGARSDAGDSRRRTLEHIRKFWTPAMQEQLSNYWRGGGEGLEPVVVEVLGDLTAISAGKQSDCR